MPCLPQVIFTTVGFTVDRERAVLYTQKIRGRLAQLVRVPGLHPGCRGSESLIVQTLSVRGCPTTAVFGQFFDFICAVKCPTFRFRRIFSSTQFDFLIIMVRIRNICYRKK